MIKSNRNFNIDFLRFVGLTFIVLAHVQAPWGITQLRAFDVPLMVFVSGLCFKDSNLRIGNYLFSRFKRLYIPTFIFLCFYFSLIYLIKLVGIHVPYTDEQVWGSFLLFEKPSIGYVWIIRVFILMALVAPFVHKLIRLSNNKFCILWITSLISYELIISLFNYDNIYFKHLISDIIFDTLGYSFILIISFKLKNCSKRVIRLLAILSGLTLGIVCLIMILEKQILPINSLYKYPPRITYIIYGLSFAVILYIVDWKILIPRVLKNVITFISEHSMWIYLWHIPFVVGANMYNGPTYYWVGKWIICYSGAIMITYLQVFVISSVQKKLSIDYNWIKYLKS